MNDYKSKEEYAQKMLKDATVNREKWEFNIPSVDFDSRITNDYAAFLSTLQRECMQKGLSLILGRYLFAQWGNYSTDPQNVDYIEIRINDIKCMWCIPHNCVEDRVIIACHGGAYTYGSIYTHRKLYAHLASKANCKVLLINYSRTPEHAWPKALDDIFSVYNWLLNQGVPNEHIAVAGDSAGGALSLGLALRCENQNVPRVAALISISPWGDLEGITPVYNTNTKDLLNKREMVRLGGSVLGMMSKLDNPELAPIYIKDFSDFPPMYLQVGACENFADDARIIAGKAYEAGIEVKCEFVDKMQHCFQQMAGHSKDADAAIHRIAEWVKPLLDIQ